MRNANYCRRALLAAILTLTQACKTKEALPPDHPRITANIVLRDVTFRSAALNRDMPYRVILPSSIRPAQKLPVVYLLHGGGGGFRDWSNFSDIARFAEAGLILVMPEGASSYYVNAVDPPEDRFEDYIVHDLIVSRFYGRDVVLQEELQNCPQRWVVSDLQRATLDEPPFDPAHPLDLPANFPDKWRNRYPWSLPIVFRAGRYCVHDARNRDGSMRKVTKLTGLVYDEAATGPGEE